MIIPVGISQTAADGRYVQLDPAAAQDGAAPNLLLAAGGELLIQDATGVYDLLRIKESTYGVSTKNNTVDDGANGYMTCYNTLTVATQFTPGANQSYIQVGSLGANLVYTNSTVLALGPVPGVGAFLYANSTSNYLGMDNLGGIRAAGEFVIYGGIAASDNGVAPLRGSSLRTSLSATDASTVSVYAVPATTGFFRIIATILGRGGTITSAVQGIHYVVGGVAIVETISISAVDTEQHYSALLTPDASTTISTQLSTLTGTSPVVDVACLVEGISAGT